MCGRRIYLALASLGFPLLALALLAGLYHATAHEKRLPGISVDNAYLLDTYLEAGDFETALRELDSVARIDPNNVPAVQLFAKLAWERGDHARHVLARRQALRLRLKEPAARLALAEALLADARDRTARSGSEGAREPLREAAKHALIAAAFDPGSMRAHQVLSEIFLRLGRRKRAALHRDEAKRLAVEQAAAARPETGWARP